MTKKHKKATIQPMNSTKYGHKSTSKRLKSIGKSVAADSFHCSCNLDAENFDVDTDDENKRKGDYQDSMGTENVAINQMDTVKMTVDDSSGNNVVNSQVNSETVDRLKTVENPVENSNTDFERPNLIDVALQESSQLKSAITENTRRSRMLVDAGEKLGLGNQFSTVESPVEKSTRDITMLRSDKLDLPDINETNKMESIETNNQMEYSNSMEIVEDSVLVNASETNCNSLMRRESKINIVYRPNLCDNDRTIIDETNSNLCDDVIIPSKHISNLNKVAFTTKSSNNSNNAFQLAHMDTNNTSVDNENMNSHKRSSSMEVTEGSIMTHRQKNNKRFFTEPMEVNKDVVIYDTNLCDDNDVIIGRTKMECLHDDVNIYSKDVIKPNKVVFTAKSSNDVGSLDLLDATEDSTIRNVGNDFDFRNTSLNKKAINTDNKYFSTPYARTLVEAIYRLLFNKAGDIAGKLLLKLMMDTEITVGEILTIFFDDRYEDKMVTWIRKTSCKIDSLVKSGYSDHAIITGVGYRGTE